jgi:excisionase family DNA binding protein
MLTHMPKPSALVGSAEACQILNVHAATLLRWIDSDKLIPVHKLPGKNGAYLFNRTDIESLAAERTSA